MSLVEDGFAMTLIAEMRVKLRFRIDLYFANIAMLGA
jgi:hypothetical protein